MAKPRKMGPVHRAQARSLAISYRTYMVAALEQPVDGNRVMIWAQLLLEDQERTGVEMIPPATLLETIRYYTKRLAQESTAA